MSSEQAFAEYEAAAKALTRTVKREYPAGASCYAVTAHGHTIQARVIGHGNSWSRPDEVWVRNVVTGSTHWRPFKSITIDEAKP